MGQIYIEKEQHELTDEQQERMCQLCEELIIDGPRCNSIGWMCEGAYCDSAIDYINEELADKLLDELENEERIRLVKKERNKYLLIKSLK
jgi:predicted ATPase